MDFSAWLKALHELRPATWRGPAMKMLGNIAVPVKRLPLTEGRV